MTSPTDTATAACPAPRSAVRRFARDIHGATAIEYGLIAAMIAMACIASFSALGGSSGGSWDKTASKAADAMNK
jgi:pilus assembly protein Flp/PilA